MKNYMVTYTEDFNETTHTVLVCANTLTEAYVKVDLNLSKDGAITDVFEIIQKGGAGC